MAPQNGGYGVSLGVSDILKTQAKTTGPWTLFGQGEFDHGPWTTAKLALAPQGLDTGWTTETSASAAEERTALTIAEPYGNWWCSTVNRAAGTGSCCG
eukprot:5586233-Amphidinium_carterae.1